MQRIRIYRVKAVDHPFTSVWFLDKAECKKIIKNIESSEIKRLTCGSQHIIEESELRVM